MRWHQNIRMVLTTLNLKNAIPTNHALEHAIKRNQIRKNHHNLMNFASTREEMVSLSHGVLTDKLAKIVMLVYYLDNNMVPKIILLHRRHLKNFRKAT